MGHLTTLHLKLVLKIETPKEILDILAYMIDRDNKVPKPQKYPNHPLFNTNGWGETFLSDGPPWYLSILHTEGSRGICLSVMCYTRILYDLSYYRDDDDNKTGMTLLEAFLDWINPYLDRDENEFLGYYHDNDDEYPTLIFRDGRRVKKNWQTRP